MRSGAIAEEWLARGGQCLWVTTQPLALQESGRTDVEVVTIDAEPGSREDSLATRGIAEKNRADWVIADLFAFSPAYFTGAGSRGAGWMIARDEPLQVNERIHAILNPGPQASPEFYPGRRSDCRLLLGLEYALIRSELRSNVARRETSDRLPRNILLTFGGSDPEDLTWRTLSRLLENPAIADVRWRVILGPGYRGKCAAMDEPPTTEFVRSPSGMGEHYTWADLVVCGASTTLWEVFHFGRPAVVLPVAPNQETVIAALETCAAAVRFPRPDADLAGWMSAALSGGARDWLVAAAAAGPNLVDGQGASRIVDHLVSAK
jgi:UDP-2,4-diacetamido-2,4,6-trideoxy-beta-L-altropyranose hydrolase